MAGIEVQLPSLEGVTGWPAVTTSRDASFSQPSSRRSFEAPAAPIPSSAGSSRPRSRDFSLREGFEPYARYFFGGFRGPERPIRLFRHLLKFRIR